MVMLFFAALLEGGCSSMAKAPIYKEDGHLVNKELIDALRLAVNELEDSLKAATPIYNGTIRCGFGISQLKKNLAVERVMVIARAIKSIKGW